MPMNMQQMNGRGRGMAGPVSNGVGPPGGERRQQQRRRKVQKGLEDNVRRTVYISYIDQQVRWEHGAGDMCHSGEWGVWACSRLGSGVRILKQHCSVCSS
jgi:hypothetical protein